ncbi:LacI family DNA-binding transcriptional regulator [Asaia siamensis]|uniref:LacI family transcriptional regulator n=1 Tax=Asaia siamensis TaxID=110479 RepID=A0ABQ1LPZ5_9PROT|nr:LacI family DNA-binding transcriptional regulator [Asaia siamensis]GBR05734.1 transcriptional regulator [Asaia siamensis NRIC 0323]GGC27143.1 LacI family transcriptional regulator [Asaia siamensis]
MSRKGAKVSIRDVAEEAQVSVATVSNVVRNRKNVSDAVRARVEEAINRLNYLPDRAAMQLREGRNRIIGVLVPSLDNPFFTALIACLEDRARKDGYDIIVASAGEDSELASSRLKALLSWRPAGMIVLPNDDLFADASFLDAAGVPYVVIDRLPHSCNADTIAVDNEQAATEAAAYLVGLGHRRLLVVATTLSLANIRERCAGITAFCVQAGLPVPTVLEVGHHAEEGPEVLTEMLTGSEAPTAIIALTNSITLGALRCLHQSGCAVPGDVSLVGYDDYAWMRATHPPITAISQPVDALGAQAWSRLMHRIAGESTAPMQVRLSCTLVVRGSTAPPRTGEFS